MSQPVNKSLIGVFIAGAIALMIIAIVSYSSISFTQQNVLCMIYTRDSINGLSVNSEVKFKGVKIGVVREIRIQALDSTQPDKYTMPIVLELDKNYVDQFIPVHAGTSMSRKDYGEFAIQHGLRARVQTSNILTGMLYVELDFFPGTPCVMRGNGKNEYFEIPTLPSSTVQLFNSVSTILEGFAEIDYKTISMQISDAIEKIDSALAQIEVKKINDNVVSATDSLNKILQDPELDKAFANVANIAQHLDSLTGKIDANAEPVATELQAVSQDFRKTLEELNDTLAAVRVMLEPRNGVLNRDLSDALEQINAAARSIRDLSNFLRRNPNALLIGVETAEE